MALSSIVSSCVPCVLFFAGVVFGLFLIVEERKWKKVIIIF